MGKVVVEVGTCKAGPDDGVLQAVFARTGSYVMGRRMFDEGEVGWPEHAPFEAPVFVVNSSAERALG